MSPPIRDGSGNSIGSIRLGDGSEISEVRTGAGDVLFSAAPPIPDSDVYYKLDDGDFIADQGTKDLSGSGTFSFGPDGVTFGDTSSDYATASTNFASDNTITMGLTITPTTTFDINNGSVVWAGVSNGSNAWGFGYDNGDIVIDTTGTSLRFTTDLAANVAHRVAVRTDGNEASIFLNGSKQKTGTGINGPSDETGDGALNLGRGPTTIFSNSGEGPFKDLYVADRFVPDEDIY
jgi:hypothetical protein